MGYQAEKNRIERKLRRVKTLCLCALVAILSAFCVFSAFVPPDTWKYYVGKPDVPAREKGEMRIHFLDVGQGDCTLIELPDGKVALIDGGDGRESTATYILRYLNALKMDTIDYLIVTHADSDHCGSLDKLVQHKRVLNAYLPTADPENAGKEYTEFYAQLLEEECKKEYSSRQLSLGISTGEYAYTCSFLYPYSVDITEDTKEDDNASSCVLWLDYQGVSVLFTGDAPFSTEELLMRDDKLGLFDNRGVELTSTEILKVAHHGSTDSTSLEFLNYLNVETAVISCAEGNPYGHPSEEVQENLGKAQVQTYRTDEHDTVMVTVTEVGAYFVSQIA